MGCRGTELRGDRRATDHTTLAHSGSPLFCLLHLQLQWTMPLGCSMRLGLHSVSAMGPISARAGAYGGGMGLGPRRLGIWRELRICAPPINLAGVMGPA